MTEPIVLLDEIEQLAQEAARADSNASYRSSCPYPLGSAAAEAYAVAFDATCSRIALVKQAQKQVREAEDA